MTTFTDDFSAGTGAGWTSDSDGSINWTAAGVTGNGVEAWGGPGGNTVIHDFGMSYSACDYSIDFRAAAPFPDFRRHVVLLLKDAATETLFVQVRNDGGTFKLSLGNNTHRDFPGVLAEVALGFDPSAAWHTYRLEADFAEDLGGAFSGVGWAHVYVDGALVLSYDASAVTTGNVASTDSYASIGFIGDSGFWNHHGFYDNADWTDVLAQNNWRGWGVPFSSTLGIRGGGADTGSVFRQFDLSKYSGVDASGVANSTAALNAASNDATANGGMVWVPPGEYSIDAGALKAGVTYEGVRGKSILKIRTGAAYMLGCDSGSSTAQVSQMTFIGITFRGRIDTDTTFDQQRHLMKLAGVQDVQLWNCDFIGWHGDAIYLAGVDFLGSGTDPRHNSRVTIRDCFFDGLTKNNRNCVSIIDGDNILVDGCIGRRFSRNDMPGFVDVEPNPGNGTFAVCRRIEVSNCRTRDHNQNFFQLNLPDATYSTAVADINVHDNIDDAGATNTNTRFAYLAYARSATDSSSRQNIKLNNNISRNAYCPIEIEGGIVGMEVGGNTFEDCVGASIIGYWNATTRHIRFHHNTWDNCGQTDGNVVRIEYANNVSFEWNTFHNCVANLVYFGLGESVGASTDIDWMSNMITGTGTTSISAKHASHTLSASSNRRRPYRENGLTINTAHFGTLV